MYIEEALSPPYYGSLCRFFSMRKTLRWMCRRKNTLHVTPIKRKNTSATFSIKPKRMHTLYTLQRRRSLESPVIAPGQQPLARDGGGKGGGGGGGGPHDGSREWIHSGRLAHTGIFVRPPRPKSRGGGGGSGNRNPPSPQESGNDQQRNSGDSSSAGSRSGLPGAAAAAAPDAATGRDDGEGVGAEAEAVTGGYGGGNKSRSDGEEAWSCCGKPVLSAGRGCEPREPLATVRETLCIRHLRQPERSWRLYCASRSAVLFCCSPVALDSSCQSGH